MLGRLLGQRGEWTQALDLLAKLRAEAKESTDLTPDFLCRYCSLFGFLFIIYWCVWSRDTGTVMYTYK